MPDSAARGGPGAYREAVTQTQTVEFTSWLTEGEFADAWVARRHSFGRWRRWVWRAAVALFAAQLIRAVVLGHLGFALMWAPVGVAVGLLTSEWALRRGARRMARLNPALTGAQRLTLTTEGVTLVTPQTVVTRTWHSVSSWLVSGPVLVLNVTDKASGLALYLGRGDADDDTWATVLTLLTERIGPPRR